MGPGTLSLSLSGFAVVQMSQNPFIYKQKLTSLKSRHLFLASFQRRSQLYPGAAG